MQSFKLVAVLFLGYFCLTLYFTPKYNKVWGQGGYYKLFQGFDLILLVTNETMQSFKIVALLLFVYFWLNLNFTPKYTIVRGQGGY